MKKLFTAMGLAACISASSLSAFVHPCPGKWAVDLEYLNLKPSFDDTFYALEVSLEDPPSLVGNKRNHDLKYHSGFRVGAAYGFCCGGDIEVYYTRLKTTDSTSVSAAGIGPVLLIGSLVTFTDDILPDATATSTYDYHYQRFDALYGATLFSYGHIDFKAVAGLEFASHRVNRDVLYTATIGITPVSILVEQDSKMRGVGPELGFELDFNVFQFNRGFLPGTLSIVASSSASLLASKIQQGLSNSTFDVVFNIAADDSWRIVPALHSRIGVNYGFNVCCFASSIEIGYEANTYLNSLVREVFPGTDGTGTATVSFEQYNDIGLRGLYVAANVSF